LDSELTPRERNQGHDGCTGKPIGNSILGAVVREIAGGSVGWGVEWDVEIAVDVFSEAGLQIAQRVNQKHPVKTPNITHTAGNM
jgi:hypothetical protein